MLPFFEQRGFLFLFTQRLRIAQPGSFVFFVSLFFVLHIYIIFSFSISDNFWFSLAHSKSFLFHSQFTRTSSVRVVKHHLSVLSRLKTGVIWAKLFVLAVLYFFHFLGTFHFDVRSVKCLQFVEHDGNWFLKLEQ